MTTSRLRKTNSLILFVILLLLVMIGGTGPGRSFVNTLLSPVRHFLVAPVSYQSASENEALSAENQRLKQQIDALKREEQVAADNELEAITAGVISYSAQPQRNAIILDVGVHDGVEEGVTVTSQGFFIGEVISVSETSSTVALVNDASFRAVGETEKQTQGILTGAYNSIILHRIPHDAHLTEGDIVYTSKLDTRLRGGIPVGRVQAVFSESELLKYAQLRSPIDFTTLTAVSVIR